MSVRIRKNGRMFCAAMFPAKKGDKYIDDTMHEVLSLNAKVLVSEPHERHKVTGEWWWINNIPDGIQVDEFYTRKRDKQEVIRRWRYERAMRWAYEARAAIESREGACEMNANAAFAEEVLVLVYKLLPLGDVLTDYMLPEGTIRQLGDTVRIYRNAGKSDINLTIDKSIPIERKDSAMNTANAIVGGILYLTPPPWKAFAATVKYDEDTDTVTCLYGVKYKKKREKKELKEKLERAERTLVHAGFTDNGGAMWKPPVNSDGAKLWQRVLAAEYRCAKLEKLLDGYEKLYNRAKHWIDELTDMLADKK